MQTVKTNLLILIYVIMLTSCGLKGPLYLPEESPPREPASAQGSETTEDQGESKTEEKENSEKKKSVSG